MLEYKSGNY